MFCIKSIVLSFFHLNSENGWYCSQGLSESSDATTGRQMDLKMRNEFNAEDEIISQIIWTDRDCYERSWKLLKWIQYHWKSGYRFLNILSQKCFFEKQTILRIVYLHIMKNLIFLNWKSLQESHRLTNLRHRCTDKGTKNKHMKEEKNAKMYVPIKRLQLKKNKYFAFKWCMGCK